MDFCYWIQGEGYSSSVSYDLCLHWFRQWLVAWLATSHYLSQCWNNVNLTLGNKHQWNFNQNLHIFIQENAFENVVWEMSAILSQPQCVDTRQVSLQLCCSDIGQVWTWYLTVKQCLGNSQKNVGKWFQYPHLNVGIVHPIFPDLSQDVQNHRHGLQDGSL